MITACAWALWIYLLLPLFSLLAWFIGADLFSRHLFDEGVAANLHTLIFLLCAAATIGIGIVAWSKYNLWRHGGRQRSATKSPVTADMLCTRFDLRGDTLHLLHSGKRLKMEIDGHETIRRVWIDKKIVSRARQSSNPEPPPLHTRFLGQELRYSGRSGKSNCSRFL